MTPSDCAVAPGMVCLTCTSDREVLDVAEYVSQLRCVASDYVRKGEPLRVGDERILTTAESLIHQHVNRAKYLDVVWQHDLDVRSYDRDQGIDADAAEIVALVASAADALRAFQSSTPGSGHVAVSEAWGALDSALARYGAQPGTDLWSLVFRLALALAAALHPAAP